MNILLAFTPFATFAVASRFLGTGTSLLAAAVVSLVLVAHGVITRKQSPRILEVGTLVLFGCLGGYATSAAAKWPVLGVRLGVDAGLLLIVLFTIAIRQPFTLQYARDEVPEELWDTPGFVNANLRLTSAWAAAFAVIVAADTLMLFMTTVPKLVGIVITVAALLAAAKYTNSISSQGV